jgi:hypothetical protein
VLLLLLLAGITQAQTETLLRLQTESTTLQTSQFYTVSIGLENVTDLWLARVEIEYDPTMLYIIGTESGSPVKPGDLFDTAGSVVIANSVQDNTLSYVISQLAPALPVSGSGSTGTFVIFPLHAGTTQLTFRQAALTKVNFRQVENGSVGESTESLPFSPVLLELSITGDPAAPPPEATATPTPTYTPDVSELVSDATPTLEPTLVNVTAAPAATPVPQPVTPAAEDGAGIPLVGLAVILIVAGGIGLVMLFRIRRG